MEQPAEGYRVAVDTVLLAAAVSALPGQKVLDMGCGVGGAMLCLAARVPELQLLGIDIQPELINLCRRNIEHNKLVGIAEVMSGDVTLSSVVCRLSSDFDHVIMNPPFHAEAQHSVDNKIKRTANAEKTGDLALWIAAAAKVLKPTGVLTLIHRADRQDEIVQAAATHFGVIDVLPIISKENAAPKRIIMRLHKAGSTTINICQSFILYGPNGRYNDAAEAVIRHGKALEFVALST